MQKILFYIFFIFNCIMGFFINFNIFAQNQEKREYSFEYPELLVSPKASERIKNEAIKEKTNRFVRHWPIQVSAVSTIIAGIIAQQAKVENTKVKNIDNVTIDNAAKTAYLIGGGWLAITTAMSLLYNPYQDSISYLKTLPTKTKNDLLIKERHAEEILRFNSSLSWKLKILSSITNLAACVFVLKATEDTDDANVKVAGGIGALLSVLPWIFPSRWEQVYSYHQEYKKKIYGPISQTTLLLNKDTKHITPAVTMNWNF